MNELSWRATLFGDGARGAAVQMYQCVEHPRLTMISQRASHDAPWVTTFHVDGLANHWGTAAEALAALEANPMPAPSEESAA